MAEFSPYPPEDFAEFWGEATSAAMGAPLDFHRNLLAAAQTETHTVYPLEFRGITGDRRYGWIATPHAAFRERSFLWVPPYGRESKLPDAYGLREGFTSMSFNFHGESAFHQEKYTPARGYFADGALEPETWIFRTLFQDAVIAMRVLQAQSEVDENRMGAMGMSQGAGISIWLGAWCPMVRAVAADMPFLGAVNHTLQGRVHRYPLLELSEFAGEQPLGMERVLHTVSYFDTINQATACRVPTQISLGLRDPACRPDTVASIYDALAGPKRLITYDWGHDWYPPMIENNAQWLMENLR